MAGIGIVMESPLRNDSSRELISVCIFAKAAGVWAFSNAAVRTAAVRNVSNKLSPDSKFQNCGT